MASVQVANFWIQLNLKIVKSQISTTYELQEGTARVTKGSILKLDGLHAFS